MARGATQAEAARQAGVNRSTVLRWLSDPVFQDLLVSMHDDVETVKDSPKNLESLVPDAYGLLTRFIEGEEGIPIGRARIALDVLKAASAIDRGAVGEDTLEKRLAELEASGKY